MDNKFIPFNHPMFNQTADGKGEPYVHQIRGADNLIGCKQYFATMSSDEYKMGKK